MAEESDWPWTDGLRHMVECIRKNTRPLVTPEHGYHVLEIMLPARRSWGEPPPGTGETYHFHRTDAPGEWTVRFQVVESGFYTDNKVVLSE